jgi:hypothetical protein
MILLAGCSFVDNPDLPAAIFGNDAYNKKKVKIVGQGGSGNGWISRGILENLDNVSSVFVLWSGLSRIDIEIPVEMIDNVQPYYSDKNTPMHYTKGHESVWFHSGGWDGTWCNWTRTKYADYLYNFMKSQYKPLNWEHLNNKSLLAIAGCLNTLEAKGIEYRFGFIYNIFKDYSGLQGSLSGAVDKNNPLLNLINWDKSVSNMPYEYCLENNLLSSDNFHPSTKGYRTWWNSIKHEVPFINEN